MYAHVVWRQNVSSQNAREISLQNSPINIGMHARVVCALRGIVAPPLKQHAPLPPPGAHHKQEVNMVTVWGDSGGIPYG